MNNAVTKTAVSLTCLAALASLTSCASEWRKDMNELKQQNILNETWPELQLIAHTETTEEGWKPSPASITNCYTLTTTPEQAFTTVLNTATNQGWTEDTEVKRPDSTVAYKQGKRGILGLILAADGLGCDAYPESNFQIILTFR